MKDSDIMPFGKHAGKLMVDVPADYLLYMYDHYKLSEGMKNYVNDNREVLNNEVRIKKNMRSRTYKPPYKKP